MITRAAIQHLRLKFSVLLMPVFWLGLFQYYLSPNLDYCSPLEDWDRVLIAFIVWHLFIYPASNAFNSYQDVDSGPIGSIQSPLPTDNSVLYTSFAMNMIGALLALYVSELFTFFVLIYIATSTLYSWRRIRLKRFPILGFLTVFIFQGAWISLSCLLLIGCCLPYPSVFLTIAASASFLFGGGYPITQIYQHEQDRKDGVKTISMLLGIKGTIIFSGLMNTIGMALLFFALWKMNHTYLIAVYLLCMLPTLYQFSKWSQAVFKDETQANYKNVMKMTWISAICNNIAFILFILLTHLLN